jgi:hypothetical protein
LTSRITLTDTTPARALESFKKNYRNEIRKTLTNTRLSFSHIDGFSQEGYELYVAFERSAGRKPMRRRDAKGHWFLAYEDETLRSGVFALDVSPIIKIIAIFSVRNSVNYESSKIVGYLSKRLIYEIVCYGISKSREYVDLAYINLNDPKKAGITAFKMGFLGDETNEYLYEYKLPLLTYFKKLTLKYKLLKSRF